MRDGWRVSLDRLPLPLLPLSDGASVVACQIFVAKKIQARDGSLIDDPGGEQPQAEEIHRRFAP